MIHTHMTQFSNMILQIPLLGQSHEIEWGTGTSGKVDGFEISMKSLVLGGTYCKIDSIWGYDGGILLPVLLEHIQYPVAVTPEDITDTLVNGRRLLATMQHIFQKN